MAHIPRNVDIEKEEIMKVNIEKDLISSFFGKTRIINYVKAFLAPTIGMFTFVFLAAIVGVLIDLIKG